MEHVNAFCCLYFIEFVKIKYSEECIAYLISFFTSFVACQKNDC